MSSARAPIGRLALLAAAVLALHVALIELGPAALSFSGVQEPPAGAFTTRTIEAPAAKVAVAAPAPPPPPARAARAVKPPAPPAKTAPDPKPATAPAAQPARDGAPAGSEAGDPPATSDSASRAAQDPASASAIAQVPPVDHSPTPNADVELGKVAHPADLQPQNYAIPESVRMRYELTAERYGLTLRSTAELVWRHDGRSYEAVFEAGGGFIPKRTQRSTGLLGADGLAPQRFSDRSRNEAATHFVRERERIVFSNNKPEVPLPRGAQDRLSVLIQLAAMVGGAPQRFPKGASITIPTAGTSELENWIFTVEGEEELELPKGKMQGLKLQRAPRREFDVKVELWLAPQLDYAPVRLRLTSRNGDSVDQRWSGADRP